MINKIDETQHHVSAMSKLLHQFKVVAELKSMTSASTVLNISQPALTKNMKRLEEQYGVPFFERHAKGVSLTQVW